MEHETWIDQARGGHFGTGELLAGECDSCHCVSRSLFTVGCEDCESFEEGDNVWVYCSSCARRIERNHFNRHAVSA